MDIGQTFKYKGVTLRVEKSEDGHCGNCYLFKGRECQAVSDEEVPYCGMDKKFVLVEKGGV